MKLNSSTNDKGKPSLKKPTKNMTEVLMDCHERELMKLDPHEVSAIPSFTGLFKRGLLNASPYITKDGKNIIGAQLTVLGKKFLHSL